MSMARLGIKLVLVVVVVAVVSFPGWCLKILRVQGSKRLKFAFLSCAGSKRKFPYCAAVAATSATSSEEGGIS